MNQFGKGEKGTNIEEENAKKKKKEREKQKIVCLSHGIRKI